MFLNENYESGGQEFESLRARQYFFENDYLKHRFVDAAGDCAGEAGGG